jgi:FdhD protein
LRAGQAGFEKTGGLHACAAFDLEGGLLAMREDVGRHNAVDKVNGAMLLEGGREKVRRPAILMVSGRAGFEIVQKAAAARVPVLCAVSAPSSLAVDLARELNLTLVAFLRGRSFRVHAGVERIALPA